jgi:hypothetical protein
MSTRARIVSITIGLLMAVVVAGAAYGNSARPVTKSSPADRVLMLRSEALNVLYGLGKPAGMTGAAYRASLVKGAALNQRYGLPMALSPDDIARLYASRTGEILSPVRPSASTVAPPTASGFDWTDATIGGVFVAGLFVIGAAAALVVRHRHLGRPRLP